MTDSLGRSENWRTSYPMVLSVSLLTLKMNNSSFFFINQSQICKEREHDFHAINPYLSLNFLHKYNIFKSDSKLASLVIARFYKNR